MSERPVLPDYGHSTLTEVLAAVACRLAPELGSRDLLGLPPARRYVLVMVDGLGHQLLARALPQAGYCADLFGDAISLTSGVPSTTATSLSCLGTGLPPGRHGIVGYSFRFEGRVLNSLSWADGPEPTSVQPHPTWLERLASAGVATSSVAPAHFEASGLTRASLRGARFIGVTDESDIAGRVELAAAASARGERSLVYLYERSLDHVGHARGCTSRAWLRTLVGIDQMLELLRERLPAETCLLITGDHGMVDVPRHRQILIEQHPQLHSGLELVAGEGRMRQLFGPDPVGLAARWSDFLGERAWVRTADQAIAEGWFGPVDPAVRPRIGDVLVAMRGNWAVMTSSLPGELSLVGMHASLTAAEMMVPLLIDPGGRG